MSPEQFVDALYHLCLGRAPDSEGFSYWTSILRTTEDPTHVLKGFLSSQEYREKTSGTSQSSTGSGLPFGAFPLGRPLRIVDVGAQICGAHAYAPLLACCETEIIGFDPLEQRLQERTRTESGQKLTLLPYAIGDGGTYPFYVNDDDANSSFYPLNLTGNAPFPHLQDLRTVRTEQVETHRLDDVLQDGPVDFLKLDVQGSEALVLAGAPRTLARTAVIHCEVEFSPIYEGQPLFPAVYEPLRAAGFSLIDILVEHRYAYAVPSGRRSPDRLIWANAVFFRETEDRQTKNVQALIAAAVYSKPTLAEYLQS